MTLEVKPEEYQRWENHLRYCEAHSRPGGVGSKTPGHVKELIVREYKKGNSIRGIRLDHGVGTDVIRKVLKQAGLRS